MLTDNDWHYGGNLADFVVRLHDLLDASRRKAAVVLFLFARHAGRVIRVIAKIQCERGQADRASDFSSDLSIAKIARVQNSTGHNVTNRRCDKKRKCKQVIQMKERMWCEAGEEDERITPEVKPRNLKKRRKESARQARKRERKRE